MILEVQIWELLQQHSEDNLKILIKGPFLSCCHSGKGQQQYHCPQIYLGAIMCFLDKKMDSLYT